MIKAFTLQHKTMLCIDIGCGTNTRYKFNPHCPINYETILLDVDKFSSDVVRFAQARASVHLIVASAEYLPFRREIANLIYMVHVLEHLNNPDKCLRELHYVCKKLGRCMIIVPNFLSVNAGRDPDHKHVFNIIILYFKARRAGFKPIFNFRAGSLLPSIVRKLLTVIMNLFSDEVRLWLEKR